jgi:hypothetical protein
VETLHFAGRFPDQNSWRSRLTLRYLVDPQTVSFICGLALAALAGLAALLHNRDNRSLPWSWLAAFCGVQFFAELFQLILSLAGQATSRDAVCALGTAVSSFLLLEFGRRQGAPPAAPWLKAWIHAPLAVVAAGALLMGGANGLALTARYVVALPAAASAAWALWLASRAQKEHVSTGLSTAALTVALYGLMTAVNVDFGRAVAAVGFLGGIWYEHRQLLMPAHYTGLRRWWAPAAFAGVAIIGVCVIASIDDASGDALTISARQTQRAGAVPTALRVQLQRPPRDNTLEKRYRQGMSLLAIGGVVVVVWILAARYSATR